MIRTPDRSRSRRTLRCQSVQGSFGAARRFCPAPQREGHRGAVELGFAAKLERLPTPGATWAPARADQFGHAVDFARTAPRFHPEISPRTGEPRPSVSGRFGREVRARALEFHELDDADRAIPNRHMINFRCGSPRRRSSELRRAKSSTLLERRRVAYGDAVRPERIAAAGAQKRRADRARDVLHLYHRQHDVPRPSLAIDGDYRPCTAPGLIPTNLGGKSSDTHMRGAHKYWLSSKYEAPRILD